jgi:purine-binding chemotaxis protein CheW
MNTQTKFICFSLGQEEFAIPLLSVREVLGVPPVTPIPQAPNYFLGIMNLRGTVISVMDLRQKLGIKPIPSDETGVIILDLGDYFLGVVVDSVNSVHSLEENEISEKPVMDGQKSYDFISGVFRKDNRLILLLDISKALSVEDRSAIGQKNLAKVI